MNIFERKRIKLQSDMDSSLNALDRIRESIGESEYWERLTSIHNDYSEQLKEIDKSERFKESLDAAKEQKTTVVRPEQSYTDVLSQLKAQKINDLLKKLSAIAANLNVVKVDPSDPFYEDKMHPLDTFERWWQEELRSLPSVHQVRNFLNKIDINDYGFIYFDDNRPELPELESYESVSNKLFSDFVPRNNLIKPDLIKSRRMKLREANQASIAKKAKKAPLLYRGHEEEYEKRQREIRAASRLQETINSLSDVVSSYSLSVELEDLLIEHIEKVAAVKGLVHVDKYRSMLEQFLRYVKDEDERIDIVKKAIINNWRILSNGQF